MTDFPGRVRGLLDDLDAASGEAIGPAAALLLDSVEAGGDAVNAALPERYRHRVPELTGE